jgi:hypothetical protein
MIAKLLYSITLFITLSFFSIENFAQEYPKMTNRDEAILCEAEVIETPSPKIILKWEKHKAVEHYKIQRKLLGDSQWSPDLATLDSNTTSFEDSNVETGKIYEYKIFARCKGTIQGNETFYYAFGYVTSGIRAVIPPSGKLLVLVDQTLYDGLSNELKQFTDDVVAEGWQVVVKKVPRAETFNKDAVAAVKETVLQEAAENMYIFLVGRVPVPYSGNLNPDGHPNHKGAWPADVFYSDETNYMWSDNSVNNTTASRDENKNIPGDGKFDQSVISATLKYPLGRVDFYNMPEFERNELQLLKDYFAKDHKYRIGAVATQSKCIVDDNFQSLIEGFSTSGWRTASLVGIENVKKADFMTSLETENHIWAYGTGGGSYTSAGGIGKTKDFATKQLQGVFTMLFGSYFGDWDSKNNFLRAPLASEPSILTCSWAGRPQWFHQHMGLGFPVGFSALLTINNRTVYQSNYLYVNGYPNGVIYTVGIKQVHQELLGDPTLRMFMGDIPDVQSVSANQPAGKPVRVSWQRVFDDNVVGYNVYKSTNGYTGPYTKLNDEPLTNTYFTDSLLFEGEVHYMVRVVALTITPSGSFLNEGRGIIKSLVTTDVEENDNNFTLKCAPLPATEFTNISLSLSQNENVKLEIIDINGNTITTIAVDNFSSGRQEYVWNLKMSDGSRVAAGMYLLKATIGDRIEFVKIPVLP